MKKLIYSLVIICIIGLTACSTSKETTQTPTNEQPTSKTEVADSPKSDDQSADMASQKTNNQSNNEISGQEIVERMTKNLQSKLALNESQYTDILTLISNAFVSGGNSLEQKYPAEKAKEFSKPTLQAAQAGILNVLDENQKTKFNQFLNK